MLHSSSESIKETNNNELLQAELNTRSLHELARAGDLEGLKAILEAGTVNVNSLCRTEGLDPLTPLACAVNNGSIGCISLLMQHGAELNSSKSLDKSARKHPLVCALESRNREVIKYVISKGGDIKLAFAVLSNTNHPSLYDTLGVRVDMELSEISILELQETPPNFEALRELIEPEVLCASSGPIDIALDLEQACLVAALISKEHATIYEQLAKQCQTFAKEFLACCQVPSDVELLLGMKSAQNTFARALAYNEKEFLTQPWMQVMCEKQWLGELGECRSWTRPVTGTIKVFLAPLLIPIITLRALACGHYKQLDNFIQEISSPCLCFLAFIFSHLLFLALLLLLCVTHTSFTPSLFEQLAWFWLFGKLVCDCSKYYKALRLTSFKVSLLRCIFDGTYITFFICLVILRLYTFKHSESETHVLLLTADVMYAIGTIIHVLQLCYVLQVTKFLGPILVSMRYFIWELLRFICVLGIMIVTFGIAITKIYEANKVYNVRVSDFTNHDQGMGMFSNFTSICTVLFWAAFGLVDLKDFKNYRTTIIADFLVAIYITLSTGLLMLLLFAMLNYQYTKAKRRFDTEWKFLTAKLTHEFSLLHPAIIPCNIISLPICLLVHFLVDVFGSNQNRITLLGGQDKVVKPHLVYYTQSRIILNPDCEEERQALIQGLAEIYLTRSSWPSSTTKHRDAEGDDAQSMTSSPTGLADPSLALERLTCTLEKQDHSISELRRANQELANKLDEMIRLFAACQPIRQAETTRNSYPAANRNSAEIGHHTHRSETEA